mmetsp:Transcript_43806/g.42272  ORF Transcript_43806/g.42272 Transcript_43806/m.42272 type:complete len:136 (-) Transcript_43806:237-644(-)
MDLHETGKVSYNDFCDIMEKDQVLPIENIVRKRRRERGEDLTMEEKDKKDSSFMQTQKLKTVFADINTDSKVGSKDLGSVQGMSEILERSSMDLGDKKLFNEDDVLDHYNEIKEVFRQNAFTFEDLLAKMGKPSF